MRIPQNLIIFIFINFYIYINYRILFKRMEEREEWKKIYVILKNKLYVIFIKINSN